VTIGNEQQADSATVAIRENNSKRLVDTGTTTGVDF
jgi:hypothetical protein